MTSNKDCEMCAMCGVPIKHTTQTASTARQYCSERCFHQHRTIWRAREKPKQERRDDE